MKKNSGFTLVELLASIAISTILLTGLSYLIFTGLRLYGRGNANIEVQNESQAVMNLVVQRIREAQGLCLNIPAAGADTTSIFLDDFRVVEDNAGNFTVYFQGEAIISDLDTLDENGAPLGALYLVEFPNDDFPAGGVPGYATLAANVGTLTEAIETSIVMVEEYVLGPAGAARPLNDRLQWLMAQYVDHFVITPAANMNLHDETITYVNGETEIFSIFNEPFTVHVLIDFRFDDSMNEIDRVLTDEIAIRSRMDEIYSNPDGTWKEYWRE